MRIGRLMILVGLYSGTLLASASQNGSFENPVIPGGSADLSVFSRISRGHESR